MMSGAGGYRSTISDSSSPSRAMAGPALFRVLLGSFASLARRAMNRIFGLPLSDESPALIYTGVVEGRKLFFGVEVREGERTIGVGTHQRRVIETDG